MQLSHGPYYTFLTLYLIDLNYSRAMIGWLWALGVLAEIGLFVIMPWLLRRVHLKHIIVISLLLAALRWWLLAYYADSLLVLLLIQVLHAATFGSFHAAAIHFVQRYFSAHKQGQGQGLYVSFSGVGGALGALYAGYTWQTLGAGVTFSLASAVALFAALLLLFGLPSTDSTQAELKKRTVVMTFTREQLAEQIIQAGQFLYARGWSPATSSNYSARLCADQVLLTVSGKHKGQLTEGDILATDLQAQSLEANKKPSAEALLHTQLYNWQSTIQAVLHTHSVNATVLSRIEPAAQIEFTDYELQKAFGGINSHEQPLLVPIFANDQNIARLAEQVQHWLDSHPNCQAI